MDGRSNISAFRSYFVGVDSVTASADPGYKFMSVIEDPDFACEPVLEIHDETLFVSDYVGNFIKTYNITDLKTIENYRKQ